MTRKVISVIFYVVAGFFLYMVSLLAFVNISSLPSASRSSALVKYAVMGAFSIPAVVAFMIGLLLSRFRHWKRDIGIVMVSGAGSTALVVFTIACFVRSPDSKQFFPHDTLNVFNDIIAGVSCIALLAALGAALIMISRKKEPSDAL